MMPRSGARRGDERTDADAEPGDTGGTLGTSAHASLGAPMDALSMNTLRIVLVGLTAIAAVVAAALGLWSVAIFLSVGIAAHGTLWWWLHRQRAEEHDELHRGVEELLRSGDE